MRITVFGATGSVGRRVVAEALARGHEVAAVVRNPARFSTLPAAATPATGDASNAADIKRLVSGRDVVVSATRPAAGHEHELVAVARTLLSAMADTGTRLIAVGGAGSLTVPNTGGTVVNDHPDYRPPKAAMPLARACTAQLEVFHANDSVDWAYISPAAWLTDGEPTGRYRLGGNELVVDAAGHSRIATGDFALAILDEIEHPRYRRTRFTAAY